MGSNVKTMIDLSQFLMGLISKIDSADHKS